MPDSDELLLEESFTIRDNTSIPDVPLIVIERHLLNGRIIRWAVTSKDAEKLYYLLGERLGKLNVRGWKCRACGVFNGEEKERLSACRSCGLGRQ